MPIVVSATGEAGLPSTPAEVDARRAARLAKQASCIKKRRLALLAGRDDPLDRAQRLEDGLERADASAEPGERTATTPHSRPRNTHQTLSTRT